MSVTSQSKCCPKCGGPIPPEAPQGLCPKCLLQQASVSTEAGQGGSVKSVPPTPEELAAAFPQLEILQLIGQGGMGYVFKARQPKLDRFVALKILPQSLAADPAFAERFAREGRMLAKLNHPDIVTIHDFGQANGLFYLLMEFVDGVNLREAMRVGRFTPQQALAVVPKICEALQFAHNEGILHRDIKPENILLDAKGRVKIADFGIAKLVAIETQVLAASGPLKAQAGVYLPAQGAPPPITLTETGKTLGTPHYMAPEQIEHPEDVDQRADIYSLGVVFYEMLTGELPIGRFAPPSEKSAVDERVDDIVLRALQKERELRQKSAEEVKTQVETIAAKGSGGAEFRGGPAPLPERPGAARHLVRGAIAALVVFFLITFGATLITFLMPESYRATARIRLEAAVPLQSAEWGFNPYLLQSELETIRSRPVLDPVIQHLKLQSRWAQSYGLPGLSPTEALQLLISRLELRPVRNTMLIEVQAFSEQPQEAAEMANDIAENYSAYCSERIHAAQSRGASAILARLVRVEILDRAVPPLLPARPNKPLNIALGMLVGVAAGFFVGLSVGLLSVLRARPPGSRAVSSPAPRPDRFWRWVAVVVMALIIIPIGVAIVGIVLGIAVPKFMLARQRGGHGPGLEAPGNAAASKAEGDLVISFSPTLRFAQSAPGWGFDCFVPANHLASILFVRWDNGVPTIDPGLSAYFKVGPAGVVDVPFCAISCDPISQAQLASMTNVVDRQTLSTWGITKARSNELSKVVQWNVNWGLGFTSSKWLSTPPYRWVEMVLPQSVRTGYQRAIRLVDFEQPPGGNGNHGLSGIELRILLEPLTSPPIKTAPHEIERTNYIAGTGLPESMEQALKSIKSLPLEQQVPSQSATNQASAETWSPAVVPGSAPDLQKILNEAKQKMSQGQYEEAMQRYIWYHNHSKSDPSQVGVRNSFALSDWVELGRRYPKARQALIEIRDADAGEFSQGRGYFDLFMELAAINRYLGQEDATVAVFKGLVAHDKALAQQCYSLIEPQLIQRSESDAEQKLHK